MRQKALSPRMLRQLPLILAWSLAILIACSQLLLVHSTSKSTVKYSTWSIRLAIRVVQARTRIRRSWLLPSGAGPTPGWRRRSRGRGPWRQRWRCFWPAVCSARRCRTTSTETAGGNSVPLGAAGAVTGLGAGLRLRFLARDWQRRAAYFHQRASSHDQRPADGVPATAAAP